MSRRLAIPLYGAQVAPRFRYADRLLIVDRAEGGEPIFEILNLARLSWSQRIAHLAGGGVEVLLCGGFERRFLPLAESAGIRVEWGLAGDARQLADAFHRGGLDRFRVCSPGAVGPWGKEE